MLSFSSFIFSLLLLLLLLAGGLNSFPELAEQETPGTNFINNIIERVQRERSVDTLLLMQRRQDSNCPLQDINSLEISILRLDERITINIKQLFNSEALTLVCMAEHRDAVLLSTLAQNLNRMRAAPIIVLLHIMDSDLQEFLSIITEQAERYSLINLLVLRTGSYALEDSIIVYRLQPFPNVTLKLISNLNKVPLFLPVWRDFRRKVAITVPSLYPPSSYLLLDKRTGSQYLDGFMVRLVKEFARKYNIELRLLRAENESTWIDSRNIEIMVSKGEVDFPMHGRIQTFSTESSAYVDIVELFVVVPCGQEMRLADVYKSMRTYFFVMLGAYFLFALLETTLKLASQHIWRRSSRLGYSTFFINLQSFAGILGHPIGMRRYRSLSLRQFLMVMSIFSLVFGCYFNANLSALLTKPPCYQHVQNFEELAESGLPVMFDKIIANVTEVQVKNQLLKIPNIVLMPNNQRNDMMFALNSSNAYQAFSKLWDIVNSHQKNFKRHVLCASPGLSLFHGYPIVGLLRNNSIYINAVNEFIYKAHEVGLCHHWQLASMRSLVASKKELVDPISSHTEFTHAPLNNEDLLWVWKLLAILYAAAGFVFIGELIMARWQRRGAAKAFSRV
ncbi:uncharacterized protein LOC115761488 [Drosophila novamexicana]|uniref:uncharacterized protein LOC115761488 n=1 Tax=Drosophila novamexicana TaxID=47314 RepID=UPI0011E5B136|nr:uncharacterized protein LOC115761488 [Drosophila novamexicana]